MVDMDKLSDDLTYKYTYNDGKKSTWGRITGNSHNEAYEKALSYLTETKFHDGDVDADALTVACVGDPVEPLTE